MKASKHLIVAMVVTLSLLGVRQVSAKQVDLRSSIGRGLEQVIKAYTPATYRQHVTVNLLSLETSNGTLRGRATVQYGQWRTIPGIRNPLGGWIRRPSKIKIWSARLVVHLHMPNMNPARADIRVDVGNIRGAVNTRSIRSAVGSWLQRQLSFLKRHMVGTPPQPPAPSSSNRKVRYTLWNDTPYTIQIRMRPSGRSYTLRSGQRTGTFTSFAVNGRPPTMYVVNSKRTYNLRSGKHKFWFDRRRGAIGFDMTYNTNR